MNIQVVIDKPDFDELQNMAKTKRLSISSMARTLIIDGIEKQRSKT